MEKDRLNNQPPITSTINQAINTNWKNRNTFAAQKILSISNCSNVSNMKKIILFLFTLGIFFNSNAQITGMTLSADTAKVCDTVQVSLSGTHACPNDVITGVTHIVTGSTISIYITVSTGICIPPIPAPTWSNMYPLSLSAIQVGNYTVQSYYNSILFGSTRPLTVEFCCPSYANAGNDTALCDVSSFQLNANSPIVGGSASWTVVTGGGNLSSSTQPNATLSNLSYGSNVLVWTMIDTSCTTNDTIEIINSEMPSAAVVEADKHSCYDTISLHATAPTVGTGKWKALTSGSFVTFSSQPSCRATFLLYNTYDFSWTVTSGSCPVSRDTLRVIYENLDSATVITDSNYVLTSSPAPQYQWYLDGNPIPGATGMTHTAVANGTYKVYASVAGCDGFYSNEIVIATLGIQNRDAGFNISIAPNPTTGMVWLSGLNAPSVISVFDLSGKTIMENKTENETLELDLSDVKSGIYLMQVKNDSGVSRKKIVKQ